MSEIIIDSETLKLLAELHFEPEKEQPKLFQFKGKKGKDTCPEDIEAFVNFREKDGYRFAKRGSTFLKDANLIPILNFFKLKHDEIKKKLLEGLGGKAIVEGENKEKEIAGNELRGIPKSPSLDDKAQPGIPPIAPASQSPNLYEFICKQGRNMKEIYLDKVNKGTAIQCIKCMYFSDEIRKSCKETGGFNNIPCRPGWLRFFPYCGIKTSTVAENVELITENRRDDQNALNLLNHEL